MGINKINSESNWGKAAADLNNNFDTLNADILKIKDATTKNKGYFATSENLFAALPSAKVGDVAFVGAEYPYAVYRWDGIGWANNGEVGGESVDLHEYPTKDELNNELSLAKESINKETDSKIVGLVVQETGDGEGVVMSQKAVTEKIDELKLGNDALRIERITTDVNSLREGKYIMPNGDMGTYTPMSISSVVKLQKGEILVALFKSTKQSAAIGKAYVTDGTGSTFDVVVQGIDTDNPTEYKYIATEDVEYIQMSYYTEQGISAVIYSSKEIRELRLNHDNLSRNITNVLDFKLIEPIISKICITSDEDLSDYKFEITYIGYNDEDGYKDKLVCQIKWYSSSNPSGSILVNSFDLPKWKSKHILSHTGVIDGKRIDVFVSTSNTQQTSYAIKSVHCEVLPTEKESWCNDVDNYVEASNVPLKETMSSNNLVDYSLIQTDYMVIADGTFVAQTGGWCVIKWVNVSGLSNIVIGFDGKENTRSNFYNYVFYDESKNVIQGSEVNCYGNVVNTIDIPSSAAYMCMTAHIHFETNKGQINAGTSIMPYDSYKRYYISKQSIDGTPWFFNVMNKSNVITVGKDVTYDFQDLQSAMDSITDDSATNRYTILVYPGTYERFSQSDNSRRVHYVSIIGTDKIACKVLSNTGNYYEPPFECLMDGSVENLSFIMNSDEDNYNPQDENDRYSYAMHSDYDFPRTTLFRNCYFESNTGPAIGLGTHQDVSLLFENCEFVRKAFNGEDLGAVFAHTMGGGRLRQVIKFSSCVCDNLVGNSGFYLAKIEDTNDTDYDYVCQNCGSFGVSGEGATITVKMGRTSFGNNCDKLNV